MTHVLPASILEPSSDPKKQAIPNLRHVQQNTTYENMPIMAPPDRGAQENSLLAARGNIRSPFSFCESLGEVTPSSRTRSAPST
mmetsp:Transcript_87509/g.145425  ORF Transcript_87509/g.145425 Transcript_87509/m.145425 type:complete len:84 (-) Transcript_87509:89-340(-)